MTLTEAMEIAKSISADAESLTLEQRKATLIINDQRDKNVVACQFLKETDWYVIRSQETGVAVPPDILVQRKAARDSVINC
jgi:hypothetical protein